MSKKQNGLSHIFLTIDFFFLMRYVIRGFKGAKKSKTLITHISKGRKILKSNKEEKMLKMMLLNIFNHQNFVMLPRYGDKGSNIKVKVIFPSKIHTEDLIVARNEIVSSYSYFSSLFFATKCIITLLYRYKNPF